MHLFFIHCNCSFSIVIVGYNAAFLHHLSYLSLEDALFALLWKKNVRKNEFIFIFIYWRHFRLDFPNRQCMGAISFWTSLRPINQIQDVSICIFLTLPLPSNRLLVCTLAHAKSNAEGLPNLILL